MAPNYHMANLNLCHDNFRNYYSSSDDADGELSEQNNSSQEQSARVESTESARPRRRSTRYTSERLVSLVPLDKVYS